MFGKKYLKLIDYLTGDFIKYVFFSNVEHNFENIKTYAATGSTHNCNKFQNYRTSRKEWKLDYDILLLEY